MRTISGQALQAVQANCTGEVFLFLAKIEHDDLASPIRYVNNTEAIVNTEGTWNPSHFDFVLPEEGDEMKGAQITIGNVDRSLVPIIRSISSPPTITMSLILADSPDTFEWGPVEFQLAGVQYDVSKISGTISATKNLNSNMSRYRFTPDLFPGAF